MQIWLTGDLHFNKEQFEYLYHNQSGYDLLCLSGDLLDGAVDDYEAQTRWVSDFLRGFSKPLLIVSGNHDLDELCECCWGGSQTDKHNNLPTFRSRTNSPRQTPQKPLPANRLASKISRKNQMDSIVL